MGLESWLVEDIANKSKSSEEFLTEARTYASDPTIRKVVAISCARLGLENVKLSGYFEAYTRNLEKLADEHVAQDLEHLVFLAKILKSREDFSDRATRSFATVMSSSELGSEERRNAVRLRLMKEFCEVVSFPLCDPSQEVFAKIYDHVQNQERLRIANEEAEKGHEWRPKGSQDRPPLALISSAAASSPSSKPSKPRGRRRRR